MAGALLLCVSAFYWRRASRLTVPPTEATDAYNAKRKLDALSRLIVERGRPNTRAGLFVLAAACQTVSMVVYLWQRANG